MLTYDKLLRYLAWLMIFGLLFFAVGFSVWTVLYTETGNGDNVEHLHATWLVAYGKVPYRDFFQHHNPLLWYVFAPFIKHTTDVIFLLDAAHSIGMFFGFLTFFIVYLICVRFFSSKMAALLSLLTLCPPYYYIYCFNYNPDTFMALFFALGLYFLFAYFEKNRLLSLCLSFEMFFLAFMFTQKVLMILAVLGVGVLFVFYKRKTPIKDILMALQVPFLCLLLFISLLYYADAFKIYWQSNYPFNVVMQKYYGFKKINVVEYQVFYLPLFLSFLSILCFLKNSSIPYKLITLLFMVELPLRCFYFSISPYYILPLMIYMTCLNSKVFDIVKEEAFLLVFVFLGVACYYSYIAKSHYLMARGQDRSFARYLDRNITPCDYILSSYLGNQSIISKDPHFYWAMFGHIDIAGEETGIAPHPDMNALVLKYKPKMVFGGVYWSSYHQNRGENLAVQQVAPEILNKYYMPTPFSGFYILKSEYRQRNCKYNPYSGEWAYAN